MRLANRAALPVLLLAAACATAGGRAPAGAPRAAAIVPPAPEPAADPAPDAPAAADADLQDPEPGEVASGTADDLPARLAARAATVLGRRAGFTFRGERFTPDCSGFIAWVYEVEGVPLRRLMARAAPYESSAVAAAYAAARAWGVVFGGGGEWPHPGDLVFFRDTYDRNRDGRFDDPFTHVGIVERVDEDGTVLFLHRGSRGVARGALTLARPSERRDENGRELNSILRRGRRARDGSTLAGRLFMGYARLDPARFPPDDVASR